MASERRASVTPQDDLVTLGRRDITAAARVLGTALADDPGFRHLMPDDRRRVGELTALYRLTLADTVRHGQVLATTVGGVITAVLAFYPAGRYPMTPARWARCGLRVAALGLRAREHSTALMRFAQLTAPAVPPESWYFQALGTRPDMQHGGRGGLLLRTAIALVDEAGGSSYLETNSMDNVRYYRSLGYECVADPVPLAPDGPFVYEMLRPARRA